MKSLSTSLSSSAFWGRERKRHIERRVDAFLGERHPGGLPDPKQYGAGDFYREVYEWHGTKGFARRDYASERQLCRIWIKLRRLHDGR